jgi:ubiquitin carboxyl-terminal hydrolase 10
MNPPAQQEPPVVVVPPPEVAQLAQEPDTAESAVSTPQVEEPKPIIPEPVKKPTPKTVVWGTKSFASLLKSPDSAPPSFASGAPASKSLPVSTQTGFSVPGATSVSVDTTSLTPRAHSNLLQLLTSGTVAQSSSQGPVEIRPRGLVNTGNMCFANVVLQVLVYSPPFWRLFTELGKYIGNGPVVGSGAQQDGKGTPFTDAVITFLGEFKPLKPSEIAERAQTIKDSERPDPRRDSFVPSNFYAALKTKSRFDAMRSGHQEDAEEFLGFLLDTLHEELLTLNTQFGGKSEVAGAAASKVPTATDDTASVTESDVAVDDEWQEVGKKNRAMITRTVSAFRCAARVTELTC